MNGHAERAMAALAYADRPIHMPRTVNGFLGLAATVYDRLHTAAKKDDDRDFWAILQDGGAVIKKSDKVFIKPDEGEIRAAVSANPDRDFTRRTQERLAMLVQHLRDDGVTVEGQKRQIFMDDLVITQGAVDPNMFRQTPYTIVQIPRLDIEIAVCEEVNNTTFVKKGTVGEEFWDFFGKDKLKERADITAVDFHGEDRWWKNIQAAIEGQKLEHGTKVKVKAWSGRPSKLDTDLVKASLLAYRLATGKWLTSYTKGPDGKSYVLQHGPLAGKVVTQTLNNQLVRGGRGLPGGSSIPALNKKISEEHNLDYHNPLEGERLTLADAKASLLAHRLATGKWLTAEMKGADGKPYVLEHGPLAGKITVGNLDAYLHRGTRGLLGGSSIPALNAQLSAEHNLDYQNRLDVERLTLVDVRASLLAHRLATGKWLAASKKGADGKSYLLEHGALAGKITVGNLQACVVNGLRGLPGGSSIPALNEEVSIENDLDYINHRDSERLTIAAVRASLLAHRLATGKWLAANKKSADGKSYTLEHGPLAGKITIRNLHSCLMHGLRGLPSGHSLPSLHEEISKEHGLHYKRGHGPGASRRQPVTDSIPEPI